MANSTLASPHIAAETPDDLLNELEAAAMLRASLSVLRNWRWQRIGPRYHKLGQRMVRYRRSDLAAFVEAGASGKVQTPGVPA